MAGKNYSRNNSGKRKESDFYETPYSLTSTFLSADKDWDTQKIFCDPCCGDGAITKVVGRMWPQFNMRCLDINRSQIVSDPTDYLESSTPFDYSIMNPPYSLANQFILHTKKLCSTKFAMLLPTTYLQGVYRYLHIWQDTEFPLAKVWTFNRFPMLGEPLREDGKFHTGMQCLSWYVWDKRHTGDATVGWLDVQECVLRKGE